MARVKIDLPEKFDFTTTIPIRITDINYGGHGGNDTILGLIHEARMQFLKTLGYTELEFAGVGMIMSDAAIEFKNELFYGDIVTAAVAVMGLTKISFDLYYKLEKESAGKILPVAYAKTAMVCFDYGRKKVVAIPEEARQRLRV